MSRLILFLRCLVRELINPLIYVVGFLVGLLINILQSGMAFYSAVPFIVPVLVQMFTRSWMSYRNRNNAKLMSISMERDEPAFICNDKGKFLVTSGRPAAYLERERIDTLSRLFGGNPLADPMLLADAELAGQVVEMESPVLNRGYAVRCRKSDVGWMVWLIDITERKQMDKRLEGIDSFRQYILRDLPLIARDEDIDERTARLILADGWRAVFIATADNQNYDTATALTGQVFRFESGNLISSELIRIGKESEAPIWRSFRNQDRILARRSDYTDELEWKKTYPLHPTVRSFLGNPYPSNLINWHEGQLIVIAFDKKGGPNDLDKQAFDGQVSTAHTVRSLIELTRESDKRFLQSVSGLSAAAETSDEITGGHIHRVNVYAENLACHMGLDPEKCRWLGQIAALHDIGKVAMPHIIKKPGKLSPDEYREMQMHPIEGFRILRQMRVSQSVPEPRLVLAAEVALNHHQNWDGTGYPGLVDERGGMTMMRSRDSGDYEGFRPLKGEEIPLEAIIVGLADKYDALRNARQYKPEFSHDRALELLFHDDRYDKEAPDVFGPEVWNAFKAISGRFNEIFEEMRD